MWCFFYFYLSTGRRGLPILHRGVHQFHAIKRGHFDRQSIILSLTIKATTFLINRTPRRGGMHGVCLLRSPSSSSPSSCADTNCWSACDSAACGHADQRIWALRESVLERFHPWGRRGSGRSVYLQTTLTAWKSQSAQQEGIILAALKLASTIKPNKGGILGTRETETRWIKELTASLQTLTLSHPQEVHREVRWNGRKYSNLWTVRNFKRNGLVWGAYCQTVLQ